MVFYKIYDILASFRSNNLKPHARAPIFMWFGVGGFRMLVR